jgi:hypothetical protein
MVDTDVTGQVAPPPRRKRRWRSVWVIAPVAFVLMLGVARVVYWRYSAAYDPLRNGSYQGPAIGHPNELTSDSGSWQLRGPAGTTQLLDFFVDVAGDHAADIEEVEVQDTAITSVYWSANSSVNGQWVPAISHPLPVHVPGHATVRIQLEITKPECVKGETRYLSGVVRLHWHALMSSHITTLDLTDGDPVFVSLCG